ncbi:MAG: leucine-rich repeat domain-containing protein [Lachnospiraceae bacterium]|nr:leucine-rich repeat domain-containing protein [Lachnospiraceae bacterium]
MPSTVRIAGVNFRITIISKSAFKNCSKLKTVTLGNNISTLGESCFSSCDCGKIKLNLHLERG